MDLNGIDSNLKELQKIENWSFKVMFISFMGMLIGIIKFIIRELPKFVKDYAEAKIMNQKARKEKFDTDNYINQKTDKK